jgi:hypothetical protein
MHVLNHLSRCHSQCLVFKRCTAVKREQQQTMKKKVPNVLHLSSSAQHRLSQQLCVGVHVVKKTTVCTTTAWFDLASLGQVLLPGQPPEDGMHILGSPLYRGE